MTTLFPPTTDNAPEVRPDTAAPSPFLNKKREGPLYHGGVPGLSEGDVIQPGHSRDHHHSGCPWCEARAKGGSFGGDGPSMRADRVYVTADKAYARYYASLYGRGDLYEVEPVGGVEPSMEDPFPTFVVPTARVVNVVQRAVLLRMSQRRELYLRWAKADGDGVTRRQALEEFREMFLARLSGVRR